MLDERAIKLVEKNAELIVDLTVFFSGRFDAARAAYPMVAFNFELSADEIATFPDLDVRLGKSES
jgi:hypothetical protein